MRTCSFGRVILLCLAIFLAGVNLTCRRKSPQQTDVDKPEPNAPSGSDVNAPSKPAGEEVAVTVDGVEIKENEVIDLIGPQLDKIDQQGAKLPPSAAQQYKKQLREQA